MGQQASQVAVGAVSTTNGRNSGRLHPVRPSYVPLCDTVKAADPSSTVTTDDIKDAQGKILEFSHRLHYLPKECEVIGSMPTQTPEQQVKEIVSSVDSVNELFHYISNLAAMAIDPSANGAGNTQYVDANRDNDAIAGIFDARIASYVKNLQGLYQLIKKEKYRYEQRLLAVRASANSQRKIAPPPLPLPTQNCMTMGWDLVIHLLKATRRDNANHYLQALQMIKDNLQPLKPTTYSDSMYLAPSASSAFNMLSDCLLDLALPVVDKPLEQEQRLEASTIETLVEVGMARGSLATVLSVVGWLLKQSASTSVQMGVTLSKLAALKEQPMYGKCEASGELYSCGQNSYGELGIGDDIERHQLTSVALCGWDDIRQVVSGNETLAVLTNDGVVLTCGLNKSGQCGQGHFDERVMLLRPVQALRSQRIKFVAASNGCEHMIALTETGLAYSWGYNDRGQLGHENLTTKIHIPKLIESMKDKKIGFAAVSYHHSAVVTDSGKLYTFGMNDCGQLGLDHTQHQSTPQLVKCLEGHEVTMVSCGLYHTIICTTSGELYTCGKNDYGQLGLGHSRQVKVPALVAIASELICFVACGYYHSIVVSTSGRAFAFGRNDYGQLGIGTKTHQSTANVVALSSNTRMVRAACGCYHTVLLSEQGQVFVFGRNNKGQLGNRGSADSLLPVPLKVRPEKNSRRCLDVAAGFYTTSLIVERKRENDDGDAVVLDQNCLISLCGRVDIDRSGEIEGLSNFGSISTVGVSLFSGKWFYEVEVVTSGLIQIGWIDGHFQGSSDQGEGVGDHCHSWSYDGNRQRRWNSGSSSYGEKWKAGDIIGCLLDLCAGEMSFFRNGINLGVAYSELKCNSSDLKSGLMPGISLERGEIIRVNLGHQPFVYPPTISNDFDSISQAMITPVSSTLLKPISNEAMFSNQPPLLDGSASVVVKDKLFVIGGSVVMSDNASANVEPCKNVWVYDMVSRQWERWTDFPISIRHHQVVAIDDSQILVIGGESNIPSSRHMDLYKCSTTKNADGSLPVWELIQGAIGAATSLPIPRAYHTASTIRVRLDSMVFMYGGKSVDNEVLGDAWYLSLDDYTWSRLPCSMSLDPGPRTGCSSAVIGECVYVFAGQDKEERFRADIWRYNTFDRLWHLCHDDNISGPQEVATDTSSSTSRSEFNPSIPEARINYSMCSDMGNIWIFGGLSRSGEHFCDLWCYSVTSQKWNNVEVYSEESIDGICSAKLFVTHGMVTALPAISEPASAKRSNGFMYLFGGNTKKNGVQDLSVQLRFFSSADNTRTYNVDPAKSVSTAGKSSTVLSMLRSKCANGPSRQNQQCLPVAHDSAICILSHLDRLAGNDVPGDDAETIQLSRCTYRSLCIDPNEQTFSALHCLLESISPQFFDVEVTVSKQNQSDVAIQTLYPLLVTLRLLKLNFFELSRCCLDTSEIGLPESSTQPGGILHSIRAILFKIAEHTTNISLSGEILWFYHAVKQEAATSIYYGFSILYPSLLERLQIMNRLMEEKSSEGTEVSPANALLIPMLVPYFTSAKMLFQLMNESETLFERQDALFAATNVISSFSETLLNALWQYTNEIISNDANISDLSLKKLAALEDSNEFKCLNVLLRAAIFWCSSSTCYGWSIMETILRKLVTLMIEMLNPESSLSPKSSSSIINIVQHTFPGKLLTFTLVSVFSLTSIRESLPQILNQFWPQLELLASKIHSLLVGLRKNLVSESTIEEVLDHSCTADRSISDSDIDYDELVFVSSELSSFISLPSSAPTKYGDILDALWNKIEHSPGFKIWKVKNMHMGFELYRFTLPSDLTQLLGTNTLLMTYRPSSNEATQVTYLRTNASLVPNRTVLSQHICPITNGITPGPESRDQHNLPPPAPTNISIQKSAPQSLKNTKAGVELFCTWIEDLQKILVWVGSVYAATLVSDDVSSLEFSIDPRWVDSPLFRGGFEKPVVYDNCPPEDSHLSHQQVYRNEQLLQQIMDNVGAGKKLLDKVRNALDPGATYTGGNPQLRVTRLKRQDSIEATLEKSGGFEAVDRAVRATFAVLLKHSNVSYTTDPMNNEGIPSEAVIDAWRSALQLRRWIVREQQKLAAVSSEKGTEIYSSETNARLRQQLLYNAVCEPIMARARLLLELSPAPIVSTTGNSSPLKLLPGISVATLFDLSKANAKEQVEDEDAVSREQSARQLKKLMETKSMEMIEEEDERVQTDIFSFLQQSAERNIVLEQIQEEGPRSLEDYMKQILVTHQDRAQRRLQGLTTFRHLLQYTETIPSCRFHIVPIMSSAFKRTISRCNMDASNPVDEPSLHKVHYLANLEFAGMRLSDAICYEFFMMLKELLQLANEHLNHIERTIQATSQVNEPKLSPAFVQKAIHETLMVLDVCCIPYRANDWDHVDRIAFPALLTKLISWKGWKSSLQYDVPDELKSDHSSSAKYPILPVGMGSKAAKIICARSITVTTGFPKLTVAHRAREPSNSEADPFTNLNEGGLAVLDKVFNRGSWYWEVSVRLQSNFPVFVGVTYGTAELNRSEQNHMHGIFLWSDSCDVIGRVPAGVRWRSTDVLSVIMNCEEQTLEFFNTTKKLHTTRLQAMDASHIGYLPTVGVKDAEINWNLAASVPAKLWCAHSAFHFPSAVVSTGLVAAPYDGSTICWDGMRKGSRLHVFSNGNTVVAGNLGSTDKVFGSLIASQSFTSGMIYIEVHILSPGKDGKVHMGFGIVGNEFASFERGLTSTADVKCENREEAGCWSVFGVLFDFDMGVVTLYSESEDPISCSVDVTKLSKPFTPAVSCLCNGVVFYVNFHPHQRPGLPVSAFHRPSQLHDTHGISSNEIQIGKSLQFQVFSCDGGEFSSSHTVKNCLLDDSSVFSSAQGSNVNLVLKHEVDTPFCLTYVSIRGPGPGYSSPLRHALVFVTSRPPELLNLKEYDDMSPEEFATLPFPPGNSRCGRNETFPVAYFVMDGSCTQISKQLANPITGRYILVKFICASSGTNIDVGYIGFCGTFDRDHGPAYSENTMESYCCDECKTTPLLGVYYRLKDDITSKMCATCYDCNCGNMEAQYDACVTALDTQMTDTNEHVILCPPRKLWLEKISALLDASKKNKPSPSASHVDTTLQNISGRQELTDSLSRPAFEDCELFSCGQNNYGELCLGHCHSTSKLEQVPFFSSKSVRDIAGGNEVLAVVMKDGAVFTCGLNKSGQCGNGTFEERVIVASPVRALAGIPISMVAAANGCEHMLAVGTDGSVYSWGYNDRGQLGLGSTISKSHTPRLIESVREKYHIVYAAVSYHHSAIVSSAGELLTFGMNDCGQLGLDHTQHQHTPQLVDALASQIITKVACGLYHTVVVTTGGEVYAFGKNDYGQLGLGHARNIKLPSLVKISLGENDEKIVGISCGYYHTVAVTEKGKVITWGRNDYGQLGIGSKDHKNVSQCVPLPLSAKVKTTSCGCYHTLILLSNGRVMVFGRNNKGQLGAGARTLPSADLPLPVPSNSLSNDDVVCIAAGFYSSYILTGRCSQMCDSATGDPARVKDSADQNAVASSNALFESLMKEIDVHYTLGSKTGRIPIPMKRSNSRHKLPFVKLHAAAWAITRALMYQSLQDAHGGMKKKPLNRSVVNSVLRTLINFTLENLKVLPVEAPDVELDALLAASGSRLNSCTALKNACAGLINYVVACSTMPPMDSTLVNVLYAHFYRNQILWVLLACGSVNRDVSSIISANPEITSYIMKGMKSTDLTSATICIRFAMLIFPLHSVAALNKMHRAVQPSPPCSGDILSMLMLLIGQPYVLRPRLCTHELGIECSSTELCHSAKCMKGMGSTNDCNISQLQSRILDRSHVAVSKAAEIIGLIRYLSLYPTWKVAVNAALSRSFAKAEKIGELLDAVGAYYANMQNANGLKVEAVDGSENVLSEESPDETGIRKPESTSSPEMDDNAISEGSPTEPKQPVEEVNARDKKSLMVWQKARESLDGLATILAAVCIVGGHVEGFREGGYVIVDDSDLKGQCKAGVLVGIKRDPRAEILADVMATPSEESATCPSFLRSNAGIFSIPVKQLQVVEGIPASVGMFDGLDNIVTALSTMMLPITDDFAVQADVDQPQNIAVQEILRGRTKFYKEQIQWRSTKALASLLRQLPSEALSLALVDSQLVSNVALLIGSEKVTQNTLSSIRMEGRKLPANMDGSDSAHYLKYRWLGLMQRQIYLETEAVIDTALDHYEAMIRDEVVRKLCKENALSWGLDAIQSPRRNPNFPPSRTPKNTNASVFRTSTFGQDRSRASDLPFGTWGVLCPLPQLNENDNGTSSASDAHAAVDSTPFHLTTPLVRVGRAADSCDLIVNDRSVSGRHFHLRRIRRDIDGGEEYYELQDFSKNGTIVNGVRVHGTSVRITPGSRISLILSRGGLVTYEFQVGRPLGAGMNMNRMAPPPIITTPQNPGDLNILIPGQEYQQPQMLVPQSLEPRSPAEVQNRGTRGNVMSEGRMESVRNRIATTQGLRLITSVSESEVPRALLSPNPAVESPRVGGFNSPRSSVLQAPGTPTVGSPTANMYHNLVPPGILSPASYQQRESFATTETAGNRLQDTIVSGALRIALGRESVSRETTQRSVSQSHSLDEMSRTKVINSAGETVTVHDSGSSVTQNEREMQASATELLHRVQVAELSANLDQCKEALRIAGGDCDEAFSLIQQHLSRDTAYPSIARHLAAVLGKSEAVCTEALRQTEYSLGNAIRLLLTSDGMKLEQSIQRVSSISNKNRRSFARLSFGKSHEADSDPNSGQATNFQEIMDENPSYALSESSSMPSSLVGRSNGSPHKLKSLDGSFGAFKSELEMWTACNCLDDRLRQLNWYEVVEEEELLCQLLTAVHVREMLTHIVRLYSTNHLGAEHSLRALADRRTLRQLVLFAGPPSFPPANVSPYDPQMTGNVQNILSRMVVEVMSTSGSQTMIMNLNTLNSLSTLVRSINQASNQSSPFNSRRLGTLIKLLLDEEPKYPDTADVNGSIRLSLRQEVVFDTMMHILSRLYVYPTNSLGWDPTTSKTRKIECQNVKGPIRLSCGIEAMIVNTYERLWSIPAPDPLLKFRHKWRKRGDPDVKQAESWMKSANDSPVTVWRPILPTSLKSIQSKSWFNLGDIVYCGSTIPDFPILIVRDDGSGLLLPPVGYERVDVTGKGLPQNSDNDPDFQKKQLRSLWWPIAPPGYVAIGCVAGSKADPFEPPELSNTRCIREDLVKRVNSFRCVWKFESNPGDAATAAMPEREEQLRRTMKNQFDSGAHDDDVIVQTSLWSVSSDFSSSLLPVITLNDPNNMEFPIAFTLNLSDEDRVFLSSVTTDDVLAYADILIQFQAYSTPSTGQTSQNELTTVLRPELSAAMFALIKQVLKEKLPTCGRIATDLVRSLISVILNGGQWNDKQGLLYCRSKVMQLLQDQEGGLMMNSLVQAFVELMIVVDERNRDDSIGSLTSGVGKESTISLPYRFHFAREPHVEMLVSHSSKMTVARHFSGEDRKFLLEYHCEEANPTSVNSELAINDFYCCRFENTPELVMTMKEDVKAEIIYYEVTILEWNSTAGSGTIGLGFSPPDFPLEGVLVGMSSSTAYSYSFAPVSGKVQCTSTTVDQWRWNEQVTGIATGDIFGCGLRLDTQEIFFTKNGQLLGIAFSSIDFAENLHPTISFNSDCKLLTNFGSTLNPEIKSTKTNFSFRFNSLDCDNVMGAFEWYEHLSQVYGVMKALMDPVRYSSDHEATSSLSMGLPDEFMLSADNFLSEISEDVCIRVESTHPYDLDLQEALVSIPLATSIRVKLDQQCETASSHCLQILQGGENAESSESEVRAFTGSCGGQEVTIEGDSFVWRFPVQSNFQCRVDRVRKGPYLKLENRDTRLSLSRDKGWQTAIGVARFDSGVHIWEVRISFVTASSNIFLGIARKDVRLDSYLGKDNRGWGWIGNRALWHNGSKQRGTYGEKFKTGDIVRMTLDLKRGTLSYALNGKDLGVAFGPGGTGPKLEGMFYPGFALYNQRDSIDLIAGHRVEDGGLDSLHQSGSGLEGGEEIYYSEDEDEGIGDAEEGIPNFRMELATVLSQMGFPMEWCVYALKHCDDDAEQAADFILANMDSMESLLREELEAYNRRTRQREIVLDRTVLSTSSSGVESLNTSVAEAESSITREGALDSLSQPQNVDKWGIAFTAVPEYSVTGRRLLATKYSEKLKQLQASQSIFLPEHDHALVQIVNEICETRAEALLSCDPLRMAPEEIVLSDEHLRKFSCLNGFSSEQLQRRFLILRNFNCRLQNSLSFIDFSIDDERSLLAKGARLLRGIIFQHVKLAWWLSILKEQQSPAAARPEIEVDRHRAREATEVNGIKESVFAQVFDQLHAIQPSLLRGADRSFKCQFVGEFGDDFGGLYRECLAQISSELQSKVLPVLKPCPNAINAVGENREMYVPNVHLMNNPRLIQMAEFFGKLIGIAVRTKTPLDLNLPGVFWKLLVNQPITRKDIESIHHGCFQVVDTIGNITKHGITEAMFDEIVDATFTVMSSTKQEIELVPGGKHVRVTWDEKEEYARAVEKYRLTEFKPVCDDITRGIATILPSPTLGLFTWKELLTLVCGKATVDIDLLRRRTIYGDGCQAGDPHIAYFWDVLGEFTDEQKSSFLRFVWGRSRLPTHAAEFTQDFKISGLPKAAGRADIYLPIAHTCFFSIDLPMYSNREVMKEKLLYAITHCQSIDADNTTIAQRAGQGLNWTNVATATASAAVSNVIAGITSLGEST